MGRTVVLGRAHVGLPRAVVAQHLPAYAQLPPDPGMSAFQLMDRFGVDPAGSLVASGPDGCTLAGRHAGVAYEFRLSLSDAPGGTVVEASLSASGLLARPMAAIVQRVADSGEAEQGLRQWLAGFPRFVMEQRRVATPDDERGVA